MKKLISILLIIAMLLLVGCSNNGIVASDDQFIISVELDTEDDIRNVLYTSYFNDKNVSTGGMNNADLSQIRDTVYFKFDNSYLPEGVTSFDGFSLELSVSADKTKEGKDSVFVGKIASFNPEFGQVYHYVITGSFEKGFQLSEKS